MEKMLASVSEAMTALGIKQTKIYELMGDGTLETVKVGSRRLVRVESIRRLANGLAA